MPELPVLGPVVDGPAAGPPDVAGAAFPPVPEPPAPELVPLAGLDMEEFDVAGELDDDLDLEPKLSHAASPRAETAIKGSTA